LFFNQPGRLGLRERGTQLGFGLGATIQAAQNLTSIKARLDLAPDISRLPRQLERRIEGPQGALQILKIEAAYDSDVAERPDLAIALMVSGVERLRGGVHLESLNGIAEPPVQDTFVEQQLRLLAARESVRAGAKLGIQLERAIVGAQALVGFQLWPPVAFTFASAAS
jgi:hypothetical protein